MEKIVTAADANRKFSKLLRAVREGQSYSPEVPSPESRVPIPGN